jgi:hypothetical protein
VKLGSVVTHAVIPVYLESISTSGFIAAIATSSHSVATVPIELGDLENMNHHRNFESSLRRSWDKTTFGFIATITISGHADLFYRIM